MKTSRIQSCRKAPLIYCVHESTKEFVDSHRQLVHWDDSPNGCVVSLGPVLLCSRKGCGYTTRNEDKMTVHRRLLHYGDSEESGLVARSIEGLKARVAELQQELVRERELNKSLRAKLELYELRGEPPTLIDLA
jgi:hypothetical protein